MKSFICPDFFRTASYVLFYPREEYHDQKFRDFSDELENAKWMAKNYTEHNLHGQRLDPQDIILLKNLQLQGNFWHRIGVVRTGKKTFTLEVLK